MRIAAFIRDTRVLAEFAEVVSRHSWDLLVCQDTSEIAALCLGQHLPDLIVSDELSSLLLTDAADAQRLLIGSEPHLPPGVQAIPPGDRDGLLRSLGHCASIAKLRGQFSSIDALEPITRLPRYSDLLAAEGSHNEQSLGLIAIEIDHGEHLYADLDPISKTDLLSHLADYLQAQLGASTQLGFVDATCFAVIMPGADEMTTRAQAEMLVESLRPGIPYKGHALHLTASAGYAAASPSGDSEQLWKKAWRAKMDAMRHGGDRASSAPHSALSARIPKALARNEFSLVLQAQWSTGSEELSGVEALLRWQGMEVGELAPDHFIPIAEASGQMARIGDWVIERACTEATTWFEHLLNPLVLAVNVSPQQFEREVILHQIERLSDEQWLDPSLLELELSHAHLLHLVDHHRSTLYRLRDLGVRFAIDGLGGDVIEADKLLRCPADTLKLHRSLVARLTEDPTAGSLAREICDLAGRFNLRSVGVGVETQDQLEALKEMGCSDVQGYLLSRPVGLNDFRTVLQRRQASAAR